MTFGATTTLGGVKVLVFVQKEGRWESFLKDNAYYNDTAIILKFFSRFKYNACFRVPVVCLTGFAIASLQRFGLTWKGGRGLQSVWEHQQWGW